MSRDCDAAMDQLSVYLDRELTEGDMEQVRAHLDDCPPCGKVFEFQAEALRGWSSRAPGRGTTTRSLP